MATKGQEDKNSMHAVGCTNGRLGLDSLKTRSTVLTDQLSYACFECFIYF